MHNILHQSNNVILCLLQLKNGYIALGFNDSPIKLLHPIILSLSYILREHDNSINCLVQLNDNRLVSSSNDHKIKI